MTVFGPLCGVTIHVGTPSGRDDGQRAAARATVEEVVELLAVRLDALGFLIVSDEVLPGEARSDPPASEEVSSRGSAVSGAFS